MNNKMKKMVVIGGGTGSSIVLRGLKKYANGIELFSIVPMADTGGSTGRLRKQYGVLGVGELRERLIALASNENANVLSFRFIDGELKGHTCGNIFVATSMLHYGPEKAIEILSEMFDVKGKIIPSTYERFDLVAEYENGKIIVGEHEIDESKETARITRLYTQPTAKANPKAIESIKNADVIIFGPGDLYTSILHNIVIDGISQAIMESGAKKIFISNLMTSLGETTGMNLQDLLDELEKFIGAQVIDFIIFNSETLSASVVEDYQKSGQFTIDNFLSDETLKRVRVVKRDLLAEKAYIKSKADLLERSVLRHDPDKLARVIMEVCEVEG